VIEPDDTRETEPAEATRQRDAMKIDEILRRINVGPQAPGAVEPRLRRATSLIWSILAVLVAAGIAAIIFDFAIR